MVTPLREATFPAFLPPFTKGVNSLEEKEFASKFFMSRPQFDRAMSIKEANRNSQKLLPFINMAEKLVDVLRHLIVR